MSTIVFTKGLLKEKGLGRYIQNRGEDEFISRRESYNYIYRLLCKNEDWKENVDVKQYVKDVNSGDIYDLCKNLWNDSGICKKHYDRTSAKMKLLRIMNAPSKSNPKEKELLRKRYPTVLKVVDEINGDFMTKRKYHKLPKTHKFKTNSYYRKKFEKECHSGYAYLTQQIEAYFVLEVLYPYLKELYPYIPIFPLHDALFIPDKDLEKVYQVIKASKLDEKHLGIKVRFKTKRWDEEDKKTIELKRAS